MSCKDKLKNIHDISKKHGGKAPKFIAILTKHNTTITVQILPKTLSVNFETKTTGIK